MATHTNVRRPLRNFFIKRPLQMRLTLRIVLIMLLSTVLTTLFLTFVYKQRSQQGNFYYMSNDIRQDIQLQSLLGIILPSIISAQAVSLVIAVGIGLFSSRKVAVPIYKFEKWVSQMRQGKLRTRLEFRETNEMKDLTIQCNEMAERFRTTLENIDSSVKEIKPEDSSSDAVVTIEKELSAYEF